MTIYAKDFILGAVAAVFFNLGYSVATIQGHHQYNIDHAEYAATVDELKNQVFIQTARAAEAVAQRDEAIKKIEGKDGE